MEMFIKDWLIPLATLGGILTAVILFITKKDTNQDIDISTLDITVKTIDKNVDKIMNNHLHHIQNKLDAVCLKVVKTETKLNEHLKRCDVIYNRKKKT